MRVYMVYKLLGGLLEEIIRDSPAAPRGAAQTSPSEGCGQESYARFTKPKAARPCPEYSVPSDGAEEGEGETGLSPGIIWM